MTENNTLNIEGYENIPVCPVCQEYLKPAENSYAFARTDRDTRWFWCTFCSAHLGYHRMRGRWKVDPYDLNNSLVLREHFGME